MRKVERIVSVDGPVFKWWCDAHIPDRDARNDAKVAHDEALQPVDLWLQQHSTFCTV